VLSSLTLLESYFGIDGVSLSLSRFVNFVRRFEERLRAGRSNQK
jgi:hypothetical protein